MNYAETQQRAQEQERKVATIQARATMRETIGGADLALVLEAIENHERAQVFLYPLQAGTIEIVATGPGQSVPAYCKAGGEIDRTIPGGAGHEDLILALCRHAGKRAAMGHADDAANCWRLVARLRAGELQMVAGFPAC